MRGWGTRGWGMMQEGVGLARQAGQPGRAIRLDRRARTRGITGTIQGDLIVPLKPTPPLSAPPPPDSPAPVRSATPPCFMWMRRRSRPRTAPRTRHRTPRRTRPRPPLPAPPPSRAPISTTAPALQLNREALAEGKRAGGFPATRASSASTSSVTGVSASWIVPGGPFPTAHRLPASRPTRSSASSPTTGAAGSPPAGTRPRPAFATQRISPGSSRPGLVRRSIPPNERVRGLPLGERERGGLGPPNRGRGRPVPGSLGPARGLEVQAVISRCQARSAGRHSAEAGQGPTKHRSSP